MGMTRLRQGFGGQGRRTMPLQRKEDWPARLDAHLRAAFWRPFSWGTHDCCLFACDAIEAMTGVDPAAPFRGRYKSKRGAYAALKRYGGGGLEETADKITGDLGMPEVAPAFAGRGDVALLPVETPDGGIIDVLGIVGPDGRHVLVAAPEGLARLPVALVRRVWRV